MSTTAHRAEGPASELVAGGLLEALRGTWELRDVVEVDAAGEVVRRPYGPRPSGRLIYGLDGAMGVVIREHGSSPAVAYAGEVAQEGSGLVRHVVHVGLPPFGEDQVRHVRLVGGSGLVLATETAGRARVELHWERV